MILALPALEAPLKFVENQVQVLILEHIPTFVGVVQMFAEQCAGEEGALILSEGEQEFKFSKQVLLIRDPWAINVNERKILNAVFNLLKQEAYGNYFLKTRQMEAQLQAWVQQLSSSLDYSIICNKELDLGTLLKSLGVSLESEGSLIQRLTDYLQAAQEFLAIKLVVLVGLKAYLTDEELALFYQEAFLHKINLLLIEPFQRQILPKEQTIILDSELCEIRLG